MKRDQEDNELPDWTGVEAWAGALFAIFAVGLIGGFIGLLLFL